jgi:hypothetical protein
MAAGAEESSSASAAALQIVWLEGRFPFRLARVVVFMIPTLQT